ncbi:MAG: peptidoglycan -binding protein [Alphaproteobacteria bacterium]
MPRGRRDTRPPPEIWPGFVDALSTLLLVTIFLLSVFVLAQFFLGQLLQGRDARLSALREELAATEDALESERARLDDMRRTLAQLNADLGILRSERDSAEAALDETRAARDELEARLAQLTDRNRVLAQSLADAERLAETEAAERRLVEEALLEADERLEARASTVEAQEESLQTLGAEVATLAALREALRRRVEQQEARLAELERASAAQEAALGDSLEVQARLREELAGMGRENADLAAALAAARAGTAAARERTRSAEEVARRAQAAAERLRAELEATREQLARIESILRAREQVIDAQEARIDDLDTRLAAALAEEVDELQRYRSDFFGRLREVLGEREDIQIVGDRFVFQSEVLFDRAEAELGADARAQLRDLADTLEEVTAELPEDLPWVLQINGHTDRRPIRTARFPSNWELSTARATAVARFLIDQGVPADRVAAAGFAEYQPIDPRDAEEAYRRNRRIEVKLTTR